MPTITLIILLTEIFMGSLTSLFSRSSPSYVYGIIHVGQIFSLYVVNLPKKSEDIQILNGKTQCVDVYPRNSQSQGGSLKAGMWISQVKFTIGCARMFIHRIVQMPQWFKIALTFLMVGWSHGSGTVYSPLWEALKCCIVIL